MAYKFNIRALLLNKVKVFVTKITFGS